MKDTLKMNYFLTLILIALAGCGKAPASKPENVPPAPSEKSTFQTAVDGFTGKTAVDAGQRAKDQIKAASAARNKNMEEIGP
jgi:hypothetical protein